MIEIPLPSSSHVMHEAIERLAPYLCHENGPWIAGGSLRRLVMGDEEGEFDIDIFFRDKEQCDTLKAALDGVSFYTNPYLGRLELKTAAMQAEEGKTYYASKKSMIDRTRKIQIQFIDNFFFKSGQDLIDDFDYTVVQLVSDGKTIRYSSTTKDHMDNRVLSLNPKSQIRQVTRICRYLGYGFKPDQTMIADMEHNPKVTYYRKHETFRQINTSGMNPSDELEREKALSRITNVHVTSINGQDIAFLCGVPFPVSLAYIYLVSNEMRDNIVLRLMPFWGETIPKELDGIENKVSAASLVKAYVHIL